MRVIFMGTPDFAVPSLKLLLEDKEVEILAAVTQPDRPRGRGQKVSQPPVKKVAIKNGIPVFQPKKVKGNKEFLNQMKKLKPDVAVVVAFGQILPSEFLSLPEKGCINLHASLLPKFRGASPIQAAILAGEEYSGVTTMLMEEELDAGDILLQKKVKIPGDETGGTLHDRLADLGAELLLETLKNLSSITPVPQQENLVSYTGKIKKDDAKIDWGNSAVMIERQIRAYNPWPGAFTYLSGKRLKVLAADVVDEEKKGVPGKILSGSEGILVQTGQGQILLKQIQPAGKKPMKTIDFIRGNQLEIGTVLGRK